MRKLFAALKDKSAGGRPWLKRIGIVGFWFFFIKGLLWLILPLLVALGLFSCSIISD